MIPVTAEMVRAYWETYPGEHVGTPDDVRQALVAVLAVAERNLRPASGPDRCSACGRTARHLTPVTELVDGQPTVVQRLGPSCHSRYLRAGSGGQVLPIGGTS
ncbi:hypothetical protein Aph02nite_17290 [Actinoplanes philippinensis]|uniref:Uncharacterized protein n=1 Tax=Actinoplanes philippinensis TaxID=35752 RepID=A0A1I2B9X2_9ACTN|nr:hypothetical protein [Actinoplanes philippinensis]GIE75779.1 hypothetical protein Aph02nite_17290 [Actinoplanes philippinensis]SFE52869.1 hypothetical protein SAMN05421541_102193 [Actinoplanes philippinensis]